MGIKVRGRVNGHGLHAPSRLPQSHDREERCMNLLSKTNLPMTLVVSMIIWAWLSLFSVIFGSLL